MQGKLSFYDTLESLIQESDLEKKFKHFSHFYEQFQNGSLSFTHSKPPLTFQNPSFESICKVEPATTMPKRTSLTTPKGQANLLHAIAHIEYSAIDLALDHCYRFRVLPHDYYADWLKVAEDEIRHFKMLQALLEEIGYRYGDLSVHRFLFDVSQKTLTLVERMAVIPRYLEAAGLDSNPQIIEKLRRIDDPFCKKIIDVLEIILEEEVDHVHKGDRWFRYACQKDGIDPDTYFDLVEAVLPGAKRPKPFVNVEARKRAGFSCVELKQLGSERC